MKNILILTSSLTLFAITTTVFAWLKFESAASDSEITIAYDNLYNSVYLTLLVGLINAIITIIHVIMISNKRYEQKRES